MSGRDLLLLCLCYFVFAEGLSWITASWPGPCLVQEENYDEGSNKKNCATFVAGMVTVTGRAIEIIKSHDNDKAIVAFFTIVLAISTIGLWVATQFANKH
jgi:hypothetical protein